MSTQQHPAAWAVFADNGNVRLWSTDHAEVRAFAERIGQPLIALYPGPPAQPAPHDDPIGNACRLLRDAAQEYAEGVSVNGVPDWKNEPDTHSAYIEHITAAHRLEQWAASIGAGGVEPLRRRECLHQIAEPARAAPAAVAVPVMTRHRTKDGILHFLTKEQMVEEIIRLDAALAAAATTQAEPAFIDSTPELHVGGSAFESWYSDYLLKAPVHQPMKQRARDAYAAGMGDPLVVTAPAAVAGPSKAVAYLDIGSGGYLDLGTDLNYEDLFKLPSGRHMLAIVGTFGADGYTPAAAPTTQAAPAAVAGPAQCPTSVDAKTMELAESVGLIGPASRVHDLHAAIQRFHDLICANATIKAAVMSADVIRGAATSVRDYPPLPMQFACSGVFPVYSADQMRAYVDADRAARAPADSVTAPAAGVVAGPEDGDSLMLYASDLEHSAIYDNHVEMQSCIRAVAARVRALAAAPTTQAAPVAQGDAEQRQMDAKHAEIYRWLLGNLSIAGAILDNWYDDAEADIDELHDAFAAAAARAQAKENGA